MRRTPRARDRTRSVQNGVPTLEHGHDSVPADTILQTPIVPHAPAQTLIVPHAPRGNALRDALRHKSALRCSTEDRTRSVQNGVPTLEHGHDGVPADAILQTPIVPHAPAWECLS